MAACNLFELFNGRIFRIPDYQRGYAWEEKQLIELWDDLDEIAKVGDEYKKHYIGTIYIEEIQPAENERWLSSVKFNYVVDGQQRLTTISILLFEILKLAVNGYCDEDQNYLIKTYICKTNSSGNSTIYKFNYEGSNKNHEFLLKEIFEDQTVIL